MPADKQEGGTMVIPGHGRNADEADVVEHRDMITIIRDRIDAMIKKGMTLPQINAAAPTSDYDGRYGTMSGVWTTDMFVEAAYRTTTVDDPESLLTRFMTSSHFRREVDASKWNPRPCKPA